MNERKRGGEEREKRQCGDGERRDSRRKRRKQKEQRIEEEATKGRGEKRDEYTEPEGSLFMFLEPR